MDSRDEQPMQFAARSGEDGPSLADLWTLIERRMGVCPNFFRQAGPEPAVARGLFHQAEFAYLDAPMPPLFKETLFVSLSRFCEVRYCVARHCALLLGRGYIAGDPDCPPISVEKAVALLEEPLPSDGELSEWLRALEEVPAPLDDWPAFDSEMGRRLRVACAVVFIDPHGREEWVRALRRLLGPARHEWLTLFLAFIRTAHFWTEAHPEITLEQDALELFRGHKRLAELLINERVASREQLREALREREAWLRGQWEALAAALNGEPLEGSLSVLVRTATDALDRGTRAAFYLANVDGTALKPIVGMPPGYAAAFDGFKIGPESLACGLAMYTGEPVITADVMEEPCWEQWRELAERFDFRGCWSFPIHTSAGKFIGTLAFYFRQPREATARDFELASPLTRTAAIIISKNAESDVRIQAEAALRKSEERFRALAAVGSSSVYRMSPDWREMRRLDGAGFLADTEGPTTGWIDAYVPPDERPRVREAIDRAIAAKDGFELEHRVLGADGTVRWVFSRAIPLLDDAGEIAEWFGAATDVTSRVKEDQSFTRLFRASPAPFLIIKPDAPRFTIAEVNDAYLAATMRRREEVLGRGIFEAFPGNPEDATIEGVSILRASIERVLASRQPDAILGLKYDIMRPDGTFEERWWSPVNSPVLDENGEVEAIIHNANDVTEEHRAEAALRKSEERLRLALAAARMGTWRCEVDADRHERDANLNRLLGRPAEPSVSPFADFLSCIHPADRDRVADGFHASVQHGHNLSLEFRVPRPDGTVRWLRDQGDVFGGSEGRYLAGACVDVTDLKEAEDAQRRLAADLSDADRKKDDFIALLAHELRNPLAPIRNGLNVLRLAGADHEALRETRGIMERQITHMVRLIDDLLDVSRINRNKMDLRLSDVTLAEAVSSAVETARPLIDAGGHTLTISVPDRPIHLEADLMRLSQVFSNLLTNSAKYTRHGGKIRLTAERRGGDVAVSVRDDGIGIPPGALKNIFNMFSQIDRSVERTTGGLGIGLALVKGLVEMHGGTVAAASEGEGRGSTFTVTLPIVAMPAAPASTMGSSGHARVRRRVLVVDDSRDGADTLARMLCLMGNDVKIANNGLDAFEAAGEFLPEVVLMDVGMPVLNGLDATRRIREQAWGRGMTIIALTGWGQEGDKERSREAGCDGHLVKPVDIDDLEKLLGTKQG